MFFLSLITWRAGTILELLKIFPAILKLDYQVFIARMSTRTQRTLKHDSTRQAGTGVTLNGLKGSGGHEVQGAAFSLGAGHGRPARLEEMRMHT